MKTISILFALLLAATPASAEPPPQSCAVATAAAVTQLTNAGVWARPIGLVVLTPDGEKKGHVMAVFEFASHTWIYDQDGSHRLDIQSRDIKVITESIQKLLQTGWTITSYAWLDTK